MPASSSIQSFFSSSPSKGSINLTSDETAPTQWTPTLEYEEAELGDLEPGPRNLALMGRVVNFYNVARPSKSHQAAQGCIKIMLADNTGVLTVRLWYANTSYKLQLGKLVSLWTVHVSNSSSHNSLAPSTAPLFTSIFPEVERNCHFMVHEHSDTGAQFRRTFNCRDAVTLPGLMTLKSFTGGGYEIDEPKLLVCVKSIGARKRYINRNGTTSELVSLGIFDDTANATLSLYGSLCESARSFQPSQTVLLLSSPGWRIDKIAKLSLNASTRIDVDPDMGDARRLRALAQQMTKKKHVNPPVPKLNVENFEEAPIRALFTLADIDSSARTNPQVNVVGYLSVVITQLNIVTPFKRSMLMSSECCGIPIFANEVEEECKQCGKSVVLRINPRVLGPIIDETGVVNSGKLIFTEPAWQQLLGRTAQQLVRTDTDVLKYLEQRLVFLRVTMGFELSLEEEIGRLVIWSVRE